MIAVEHGLELSFVTAERERRGVAMVTPEAFELAWRGMEWDCYVRHSLLPHYIRRRAIRKLLKAGWGASEVVVALGLSSPVIVTTLQDAFERFKETTQFTEKRRRQAAEMMARLVLRELGPKDHLELAQWVWPLSLSIEVTRALKLLRRFERDGEVVYELGRWRLRSRCAWLGCSRPSRVRSKYCSRNCSNKNARSRHKRRLSVTNR